MANRRHEHGHPLLAPHQIILRPLVTEKGMHRSTRYNAYAFEVNRMATKDDVRRAVEELFNVKVRSRAHAEPQGQAAPHAVQQRLHEGLEEGDREARPRTSDRLLLRSMRPDRSQRKTVVTERRKFEETEYLKDERCMGIRRYKPVTPGRRGATVSDFAELTQGAKPEKSLLVPEEKARRPQQPGPDHRSASWRRSQADASG